MRACCKNWDCSIFIEFQRICRDLNPLPESGKSTLNEDRAAIAVNKVLMLLFSLFAIEASKKDAIST